MRSAGGSGRFPATDVTDPRPFIGDPVFVPFSSGLGADPIGLVKHFAGLIDIDATSPKLWIFAHVAAEFLRDW